jgi:hypothetical protein
MNKGLFLFNYNFTTHFFSFFQFLLSFLFLNCYLFFKGIKVTLINGKVFSDRGFYSPLDDKPPSSSSSH